MLSIITGMLTDVGFLGAFFQTVILIFFGFLFRRRGIIEPSGKKALTAMVIGFAAPSSATVSLFAIQYDREAQLSSR